MSKQFKGADTTLPNDDLTQDYIDSHTFSSKTLVTKNKAQEHLVQTLNKYGVANAPATVYINGHAVKNTTLTAEIQDPGGVPHNGISYQWYADDNLVDGANNKTFLLTQNHIDKRIKVRVIFKDLMGVSENRFSAPTNPVANEITGYFKGSAVKGLKYATETFTGTTDESGAFKYQAGERIKFYLGDLYLGQSLAADILYPSDIAASNLEMGNIVQLLQTLDVDSNPDNGIDVSRFLTKNTKEYLPYGTLLQIHINEFDASKTLVSEENAKQFLTAQIENDRNANGYTNGYTKSTSLEKDTHYFTYDATGRRTFEIPTLACAQINCCQVSVLKDGATEDEAIADQNRVIRFSVQQQFQHAVTIKIQAIGTQACYYKPPIAGSIQALDQTHKTINAQGQGNNSYPALKVLKSNQHYYLEEVISNPGSPDIKIKTIKSIGLAPARHIKHTATKVKYFDKDGVDAHANSIKVYDYLKNVLNMDSYNDKGGTLSATTNYLYPRFDMLSCGKRSDAGSWFNAFSGGNRIFYTPAKPEYGHEASFASVVNVAAHEWGHSVTNSFSKLAYSRESGALNEAFSDWLGIAIKQHYSTGVKSWTIGLNNHPPLRSIKNPSSISRGYSSHQTYKILKAGKVYQPTLAEIIPYPDTYKGENWHIVDENICVQPSSCGNDYCGVHYNSSVANKMFYLLSFGGTHNGITVTGIGINNAMKVALDANKNQWTRVTTFHDAKAGMITSAGNDVINGINVAEQVKLAWEAINVLDSNKSGN
ncbi:hypothetical protein THERMOS_433 [Bathymodiolus thermophilus thioautotrophic gill symbiont]|uniref:Neutral metalloproteinase n=1 Tax=Bathymodiolus thermophilus thioautotrophic gill symbiont TaxID=2360 RepID=A0A8H8XBI5_9GAMM|nr:hypothetical protein THERMOS_433 [Bathymodiolus thermophilus thioautotrophic gill symbiont]